MKKRCVKSLVRLNNPLAAREYAFLLLKFRLRSEEEIALRLRQKKFSEEVIRETICFLKDKNFIDDSVFAKAWVNSRLKRPLGLRRIQEELRQKGIDKKIIEDQIFEVKKDYPEDKIVARIAGERLSKLKKVEPICAKRRVYSYLIRRGFSADLVLETVNKLCKPTY
ncbi:MAG: regulatory protein RecX [Candidatus Omnitrophica bacterium]|nr:regulatory protein RecX [Candidatus Omnitrophota bacterium]